MRKTFALVAVAVALTAVACGDSDSDAIPAPRSTTPSKTTVDVTAPVRAAVTTPAATPTARDLPSGRNMPAGYITRDTWSGEWPFTVDEGTLMCASPSRVTFTANRTMYALNGAAKQAGGLDDINEIWASSGSGLKANLGPVINAGLKLC
ncbi:DUF2511 domain-containing protein [Rhodococcus sp. ABRD24]|uniref:DUF2511 domain-containing protein n=1 Tax=Rhodococcus sp. ABRD24 TaxID=2507582 RepID=UPI0013F14FD8|nr:DUF2511 domain-containing protein [Rhodococcus sp. ABRD24]